MHPCTEEDDDGGSQDNDADHQSDDVKPGGKSIPFFAAQRKGKRPEKELIEESECEGQRYDQLTGYRQVSAIRGDLRRQGTPGTTVNRFRVRSIR
jgi:hypothetical protein